MMILISQMCWAAVCKCLQMRDGDATKGRRAENLGISRSSDQGVFKVLAARRWIRAAINF